MSVIGHHKEFYTRKELQNYLDRCDKNRLKLEIDALHMTGNVEIMIVDGKVQIRELNEYIFDEHTTPENTEIDTDISIPEVAILYRADAKINPHNDVSIQNAATMWYGRAKSGKTRALIEAFTGEKFIFLDFDRNYESTIKEIQKSGAIYLNGDAAFDVLTQLASGRGFHYVVIIDALGSIVKRLARWFIRTSRHADAVEQIKESIQLIGISHEATLTFFNLLIEPMTRNFNSINIIHHTTENHNGSKMEGNKGAWMSVFDFTYYLDPNKKAFFLEAGRLPIAPKTIGMTHSPRKHLVKLINSYTESRQSRENGKYMDVAPWNKILKSSQSIRPIMNQLLSEGKIITTKTINSRAIYIDVAKTLSNLA
jgi:hypothetical protein